MSAKQTWQTNGRRTTGSNKAGPRGRVASRRGGKGDGRLAEMVVNEKDMCHGDVLWQVSAIVRGSAAGVEVGDMA